MVSGDPIPEEAEDEPAEGEGRHEVQDNEPPSGLDEGGPYVQDVGEAVSVHHVAELDVAAAVFGHQAVFANPPLWDVLLYHFSQGMSHFESLSEKRVKWYLLEPNLDPMQNKTAHRKLSATATENMLSSRLKYLGSI